METNNELNQEVQTATRWQEIEPWHEPVGVAFNVFYRSQPLRFLYIFLLVNLVSPVGWSIVSGR